MTGMLIAGEADNILSQVSQHGADAICGAWVGLIIVCHLCICAQVLTQLYSVDNLLRPAQLRKYYSTVKYLYTFYVVIYHFFRVNPFQLIHYC